jgi:hypothetical protein
MLLVRWSQFISTRRYSKLGKWDLMQIRLVKMAGAYSKPFNISIFWYYIKQIMNVFIRAMVRIFSFGERWNVPFNSAVASLNGTFHLSPHQNILTIALINIHYLYNKCVQPCITIFISYSHDKAYNDSLLFVYLSMLLQRLHSLILPNPGVQIAYNKYISIYSG